MKLNRKGFTLVELLAVFVVLGIIAAITIPAIGGIIHSSKENVYTKQIETLKNTAKTYMASNSKDLPKTTDEAKCISLEQLKKEGILKKENIRDPRKSNEYLDGGILVRYNGVKYTYEYMENLDECETIG